MKKILKWLLISIVSALTLVLLIGFSFLNFSPQFGEGLSDAQVKSFEETGHFENGIFVNDEAINMEISFSSVSQMLKEFLNPNPNREPKADIKVAKITSESINQKSDTLNRITWFGHSTFLIEMEGKNILIDPIFSKYAAPHPLLGKKRYNSEMPISIENLPDIDAILISHDHYDHLDYESIKELMPKTKKYYVPLGVANHLKSWGIKTEQIVEMDWWQEEDFDRIKIAFTPSRHMSGRGITDQSCTLWGSWVLKATKKNIYFSGDGGYGEHFKTIGEKYGPFDIALLECGQYNELWEDVHMMPEKTAQAGIDVKAKLIVPIHWASFTLSTHSWTDPIVRVSKAAKELNIAIATPRIGEPIIVGAENYPSDEWWKEIQ